MVTAKLFLPGIEVASPQTSGGGVMRDNRTPTDVCGEARIEEAESCYPMT